MKPDKLLSKLGFDYPRQQQYVSSLSGGERRRLHLASVLQRKPNFLILDEPTNDLDLQTIEVCSPRESVPVAGTLMTIGSSLRVVLASWRCVFYDDIETCLSCADPHGGAANK